MIFFKRSFSIFVIILSVLTVYTKDSDLIVKNNSDFFKKSDSNPFKNVSNLKEIDLNKKSKHMSPYEMHSSEAKPRAGFGVGTGGNLYNEFWHSLYVDRAFNSSFALNIPLFTITVPGYGRGLKYETPLSALNVGMHEVLLLLKCFYFISFFFIIYSF